MRSSMVLLACCILFAVSPAAAADYDAAVNADGPIAYWRLNEAGGATQFQPETGHGTIPLDAHDGDRTAGDIVNDSGPEAGVSGVPFGDEPDNKAVFLPNTGPWPWYPTRYDDYLVTNSEIDLSGTGDFTLEMWARHEGDSAGFAWGDSSTSEDLMGNLDLGVNVDGFVIEIQDPDAEGLDNHFPDSIRMRTDYSSGGTTDFQPAVPEGVDWAAWHHYVFTTLSGTGSVYMDGALVASTPWNGSLTSTGEILAFGQDRCWKGDFDEIALYNKGLSANDVARHYDAAVIPEPSTLALVALGLASLMVVGWRRP